MLPSPERGGAVARGIGEEVVAPEAVALLAIVQMPRVLGRDDDVAARHREECGPGCVIPHIHVVHGGARDKRAGARVAHHDGS